MAKDDRRKTFAANNAKERRHDRAVHDEQRGRRRTCGAPVIERTTHDTQQQLLRDEKLLNEPKLKPLELKNHHETIQDQLQTYKKKLASDLQDDLSRADLELHNGMADLANTFDEKCSIIHDAGEVFRGHIADEILEVNKEQIMLNEYMEGFKGLYQQKETKLRGLWEDYVNVQKQIMELALVILDDDDVAIAVSNPGEESDPAEQTPSKDPELDEDGAVARRNEFRQEYQDALDAFVGLEGEVQELTSKALDKNNNIYKAFQDGQKKLRDTMNDYLTTVQL